MNSQEIFAEIQNILTVLLESKGAPAAQIEPGTPLYENGLGLDSMDTATFAAMLSESFGDDPYLSETIPQTVSQVVEYYTRNGASHSV